MMFWSSAHVALWARGKDRAAWLNGLVTCDVSKLAPGSAVYGLLLEKKGRIVTDMVVGAAADAFVLVLPRATADGTYATLDHHLIMEDVELSLDLTARVGFAHGEVPTVPGAAFVGAYPVSAKGGAVDALIVAPESVAPVEQGVSEEAWEAFRVRRGVPRFGVDFDATHLPQEASLERLAVAFDKGCYLGQEVVYMLENRGKTRQRLVALDIPGVGDDVARGASVVSENGDSIGEVTSAVSAGTLAGDGVRAIARVKTSAAPAGARVRVSGREATVHELLVHEVA